MQTTACYTACASTFQGSPLYINNSQASAGYFPQTFPDKLGMICPYEQDDETFNYCGYDLETYAAFRSSSSDRG
jgi:hypothetical protein